MKQKTQILNQFESLLYTANPELIAYCQSGVPAWLLKLLKRYPTAVKLAKARATSVARIPYVTADRAKELIEQAKRASPLPPMKRPGTWLRPCRADYPHGGDHPDSSPADGQTVRHSGSRFAENHSGISDASAIGLMLEIQSVKRFSSVKKLAAHLTSSRVQDQRRWNQRRPHETGTQGTPEDPLHGRHGLLTQPHIRKIYEEHTEKGMEKMAAIGLCMHKILRIIYAC